MSGIAMISSMTYVVVSKLQLDEGKKVNDNQNKSTDIKESININEVA